MNNTSVADRGPVSNGPRAANDQRYSGLRVEVTAFKEYSKNTLLGFCDLTLPSIGLKIIGATLHARDADRWIGLPARPYQEGGEQKWAPILDFAGKEAKNAFQKAALAALDAFLNVGSAKQ